MFTQRQMRITRWRMAVANARVKRSGKPRDRELDSSRLWHMLAKDIVGMSRRRRGKRHYRDYDRTP